eukprot:gene10226-21322_t
MRNNNGKSRQAIKGVIYDDFGQRTNCVFCSIASHSTSAVVVYEDERYVCFKDIAPVTDMHLLVVPRTHIRNLVDLSGKEDAQLIRDMEEVGRKCFGAERNVDAQYCFHRPPFNSIDHLHVRNCENSFWCISATQARVMVERLSERPSPIQRGIQRQSLRQRESSLVQEKTVIGNRTESGVDGDGDADVPSSSYSTTTTTIVDQEQEQEQIQSVQPVVGTGTGTGTNRGIEGTGLCDPLSSRRRSRL